MGKDYKATRAFVKRFVNPILRNMTHLSRGPYAMLRHVGRKSGKTYEIPIMVWRVPDGFIISLTYGPNVDLLFDLIQGSQTRLVMRIVHSRKPLALGSPSRAFAMTRAMLSRSQAELVLLLITKGVREPIWFSDRFGDRLYRTNRFS